jgi:hypothetical protein
MLGFDEQFSAVMRRQHSSAEANWQDVAEARAYVQRVPSRGHTTRDTRHAWHASSTSYPCEMQTKPFVFAKRLIASNAITIWMTGTP